MLVHTACVKARYRRPRSTYEPSRGYRSGGAAPHLPAHPLGRDEALERGGDRGSRALASPRKGFRKGDLDWGRQPRRAPRFRPCAATSLATTRCSCIVAAEGWGRWSALCVQVARSRPEVAGAGRRGVSQRTTASDMRWISTALSRSGDSAAAVTSLADAVEQALSPLGARGTRGPSRACSLAPLGGRIGLLSYSTARNRPTT